MGGLWTMVSLAYLWYFIALGIALSNCGSKFGSTVFYMSMPNMSSNMDWSIPTLRADSMSEAGQCSSHCPLHYCKWKKKIIHPSVR